MRRLEWWRQRASEAANMDETVAKIRPTFDIPELHVGENSLVRGSEQEQSHLSEYVVTTMYPFGLSPLTGDVACRAVAARREAAKRMRYNKVHRAGDASLADAGTPRRAGVSDTHEDSSGTTRAPRKLLPSRTAIASRGAKEWMQARANGQRGGTGLRGSGGARRRRRRSSSAEPNRKAGPLASPPPAAPPREAVGWGGGGLGVPAELLGQPQVRPPLLPAGMRPAASTYHQGRGLATVEGAGTSHHRLRRSKSQDPTNGADGSAAPAATAPPARPLPHVKARSGMLRSLSTPNTGSTREGRPSNSTGGRAARRTKRGRRTDGKFIRQSPAGVVRAARSELDAEGGPHGAPDRLTFSRLRARLHDVAARPTAPVLATVERMPEPTAGYAHEQLEFIESLADLRPAPRGLRPGEQLANVPSRVKSRLEQAETLRMAERAVQAQLRPETSVSHAGRALSFMATHEAKQSRQQYFGKQRAALQLAGTGGLPTL